MEMTLRWFGSKFDTVTLKQIRQIPGVTGVITTLYDSVPGEAWELEDIRAMKREVEAAGLKVGVYFFTQATNNVEAVEEASAVIELIKEETL